MKTINTHALPVPVHWQTDFTPKRAFAFTRFRSETSYRSEVLAPVQQLGWTHARVTYAGMTFCGSIMPQEGTVVNSSRRESLPGVMLTPPILQVESVLLPARANSVAAPVAPPPPLRRISWFATTWQGGHVGGQNKRIFPRRIYMKIELSSQRREMLLFLTTNMGAVTSRANQQFSAF